MRKIILVFCVSLFLIMAFSGSSLACLEPSDGEDLVFEGDFLFDLDGMYSIYGIGYPLNVLGLLEVSDDDGKLGDLSLNGQKNYPAGEWDDTYCGHWSFHPEGEPFNSYQIGIFPDLKVYEEGEKTKLGFTLNNFNEALGISDEIPRIVGSLDGENFEGSPVPIPASVLLLGSGLIGFIGLKRRKR